MVNNLNLINIEEPNKPETTQKCLGIDFGTTNSVCSLKVNNKVVFIEDFNKKNLIPSIVYFGKTIKVGNEIQISKGFDDCIFSIKRNFNENPDQKIEINSKNETKSSVEIAKEIFCSFKEN